MSRIEKGEVGVAFLWDYNALGYRDQFVENNPDADFEINIPSEGSIQSGYCTILNAYSQRPHAAAMAVNSSSATKDRLIWQRAMPSLSGMWNFPLKSRKRCFLTSSMRTAVWVNDQAAWTRPPRKSEPFGRKMWWHMLNNAGGVKS